METIEAVSALDAKRSAEAQIARAAHCPPWRHVIFGLLMGGLIATPAFDIKVRFAILFVLLALIPVIIRSDRKRMGMFINGYRRGKTRLVTFPMLVVEMSLYAFSAYRGIAFDDHSTPLILGVIGVIIGIAGSYLWQSVFVREMGA